jgi:HK97 gp10 family phage protein
VVDVAACKRFARSPAVMEMLDDGGLLDEIVAEMRRLAPKDTGEGAESIDFELDESGDYYRVSWGKAEFYMYFFEVGTDELAPRPFMRPVADRYNR